MRFKILLCLLVVSLLFCSCYEIARISKLQEQLSEVSKVSHPSEYEYIMEADPAEDYHGPGCALEVPNRDIIFFFNNYNQKTLKFLRSSDRGLTWQKSTFRTAPTGYYYGNPSLGLRNNEVILIHGKYKEGTPTDARFLVWYSTDYGATWTLRKEQVGYYMPASSKLCIFPENNPRILVATEKYDASGNAHTAILSSSDGGITWTETHELSIQGYPNQKAADPTIVLDSKKGRLYLFVCDYNDNWQGYYAYSDNWGTKWTTLKPLPNFGWRAPGYAFCGGWILAGGTHYVGSKDVKDVILYASRDAIIWWELKHFTDLWGWPVTSLPDNPTFLELSPGNVSMFYTVRNQQDGSKLGRAAYISFTEADFHNLGKSFPGIILSKASLARESKTTLADCEPLDLRDCQGIALTVEGTYHTAATAGARLRLYSSFDGNNWDTEPVEPAKDLAFGAGQIKQETFITSEAARSTRFLKLTIENLDAAQAITNIKVTATLVGD